MKVKTGRAFTKQTHEQRLLQTVGEHNMANVFFKYVPEQSMTDNEILNTQRILQQNQEMGTKNSQLLNIDLKKWNLKFRHYLVWKFGNMLDQLYGFERFYTDSHLWFVNCNVFNSHRLCPPNSDAQGNPIEGPNYTDRHLGGFEGMHQKKWTWITICLLKLCLEEEDLQGSIMIQGDNIVVLLHFTKDELPTSHLKRESLLHSIDQNFGKVNHQLKKLETWYSNNLHEYGKKCYYKGAAVSQGTKKASKIIPDINDGLFSLDSSLSTINTITESLAREDYSSEVAFLMNQMVAMHYMERKKMCHLDDIILLMLYPLDFGGIPLSSYHCHSVRGHDDKVTIWLGLLKTTEQLYPKVFNRLLCIWDFGPKYPVNTPNQRSRLFEDIYSLNIKCLPSINMKLKDCALTYLKSDAIKNPMVRSLYKDDVSLSKDNICRAIDSMVPMFLSLAHELYTNSNYGLLLRFRNKFTSISTISKIVQSEGNWNYIDMIQENNVEYVKELNRRINRRRRHHLICKLNFKDCETKVAKELRVHSWNKDFINLTKPTYMSQYILKKWDEINQDHRLKSIFIRCDPSLKQSYNKIVTTLGLGKGFIGKNTVEKLEKPTIDISTKTSRYRSIKVLGKIRSYAVKARIPGLVNLATSLIEEKLMPIDNVKIEEIEMFTPQITGGNMLHRLISSCEKRYSMSNNCMSKNSHFNQTSNNMSDMTAGGKDFSVFYQYAYVCNIQQLSLVCFLKGLKSLEYGAILQCWDCCTEDFSDVTFELLDPEYCMEKNNIEYNEPLQVTTDLHKSEIIFACNIHYGLILARNIDCNFRHSYLHKDINEKLARVIRDSLSVNDFRLLDIEFVIFTALLGSYHVYHTLKNYDQYIMSRSSDNSLDVMCSYILESKRVLEFFSLLPKNLPVEHYAPLRSAEMSQFVMRNIRSIIDYRLRYYLIKFIQFKTTKKISTGALYKTITFMMPGGEDHNVPFLSRVREYYKEKLTIIRATCDLSEKEAFSLWRTLDRFSMYYKPYEPLPLPIRDYNLPCIELNKLFSFYRSRNNQLVGLYGSSAINHACREIGCISSAADKYIECIFSLKLYEYLKQQDDKLILSLAEGSGGTVTCLAILFPTHRCGYNTLIQMGIDNRTDNNLNFPPSSAAKGIVDTKRYPYQSILCEGETDILTDAFIYKLKNVCSLTKVCLLTMDAENVKRGNNLNFVQVLLPVIIQFKIPVSILKVFWSPPLYSYMQDSLKNVLNLKFLFFKPVSSNPISNEIFLIILDLNQLPKNELLPTIEYINNKISYYGHLSFDGCALDGQTLRQYLFLAKDRLKFFKALTGPTYSNLLSLITPIGNFIREHAYCSVICDNFIDHIMHTLLNLHYMRLNQTYFYPIIRRSNISERIHECAVDLVSSLVFFSYRNVYDTYRYLYNYDIKLTQEWRDNPYDKNILSISSNNWFDNWNYAKFFILEWSRYELNPGMCNCKRSKPAPRDPRLMNIIDNLINVRLIRSKVRQYLFPPKF